MASKYSRAAQKSKRDESTETSASIDQQVQSFLQSGGKIQYINTGVSGQRDDKGPKHITLGKTPAR